MAKRKYKCPLCGHTSVMKENDVRICLTCGFQSLPTYVEGSYTMEMMMSTAPRIVKELKFYDEKLERYWVPSILDVNQVGMIFPEGNEDHWNWSFAPYVAIPTFERIKYPIPGKEDEFYEYKLDLEKVEHFDHWDFSGAMKKLGVDEEELV
jgi:hypothetical protein